MNVAQAVLKTTTNIAINFPQSRELKGPDAQRVFCIIGKDSCVRFR